MGNVLTGTIAAVPAEPGTAAPSTPSEPVIEEQAIMVSILPSVTTVKAATVFEDGDLIEVTLRFVLNSSTITTIRLCPKPGQLRVFCTQLDAGQECELDDWKSKLSVRGENLVFQGGSLITHLPRDIFGKHLANAIRPIKN